MYYEKVRENEKRMKEIERKRTKEREREKENERERERNIVRYIYLLLFDTQFKNFMAFFLIASWTYENRELLELLCL